MYVGNIYDCMRACMQACMCVLVCKHIQPNRYIPRKPLNSWDRFHTNLEFVAFLLTDPCPINMRIAIARHAIEVNQKIAQKISVQYLYFFETKLPNMQFWFVKSGSSIRTDYVRFDVFTAVTMKNGVFWDVMPCCSCKNRRFGVTWRFLHQGDKNRWIPF
jgi:hypothetical protein